MVIKLFSKLENSLALKHPITQSDCSMELKWHFVETLIKEGSSQARGQAAFQYFKPNELPKSDNNNLKSFAFGKASSRSIGFIAVALRLLFFDLEKLIGLKHIWNALKRHEWLKRFRLTDGCHINAMLI